MVNNLLATKKNNCVFKNIIRYTHCLYMKIYIEDKMPIKSQDNHEPVGEY